MTEIGLIKQFNLRITFVSILCLTGIVFSILYISLPSIRTELTFIGATIAALAAISSAFYVGESVRLNFRQTLKHNAFTIINNYSNINMTRIRSRLELYVEKEVNVEELYSKITSDEKLNAEVVTLLNYFEGVSIAIQHEYADEKILYTALKGTVKKNYIDFLPYIKREREKLRNPKIFLEFEKLASRWSTGQYLRTGETAPTS